MFTKAGKQAIYAMASQTNYSDVNTVKAMFPSVGIKNTDGQDRWISHVNGNLISGRAIVTNRNAGFAIGSGSTTATEDDYFLENQITSGFNMIITGTWRNVDSNGKLYEEYTFSITNTSSSTISVSEIALISNSIIAGTSASATSGFIQNNVMLDRTVLDTPISIPPTETGALKYRITFDMSFT